MIRFVSKYEDAIGQTTIIAFVVGVVVYFATGAEGPAGAIAAITTWCLVWYSFFRGKY